MSPQTQPPGDAQPRPERPLLLGEGMGFGSLLGIMVGGVVAGPLGAVLGSGIGMLLGGKAACDSARRLNVPVQ